MMMSHHLLASLHDVAISFLAFMAVFTFSGVSKSFAAKLMGDDQLFRKGRQFAY